MYYDEKNTRSTDYIKWNHFICIVCICILCILYIRVVQFSLNYLTSDHLRPSALAVGISHTNYRQIKNRLQEKFLRIDVHEEQINSLTRRQRLCYFTTGDQNPMRIGRPPKAHLQNLGTEIWMKYPSTSKVLAALQYSPELKTRTKMKIETTTKSYTRNIVCHEMKS